MAPKAAPPKKADPPKPAAKAAAPTKEAAKAKDAPKPAAKAATPAKAAPKASGKKSSGKAGSAKKAKKEAPQNSGVHITGLDFEGISKDTIADIFKSCPKILEVRIRHGHHVLVFFEGAQGAKKALELNGKVVYGNKITVTLAKRAKPTRPREQYCKTIWVGGLPGGTTRSQLAKHFAEAGKIVKVRVYREKHMGFVYFENNQMALKAMKLTDKPFAHGKDVSKVEHVPLEWQRKLSLALSIRTRKLDRRVAKKHFLRRPPSQIHAAKAKGENRKAIRAALAKAKAKKEEAKKTSDTKKGSATKKTGSATKKAGSGTKKAGSGTKKAKK